MAAKWYPVIDYSLCVECGACSKLCPHGVYDKSQSPKPVVVKPENCMDRCRGCQRVCSNGAISYVGDNSEVSDCCKCC